MLLKISQKSVALISELLGILREERSTFPPTGDLLGEKECLRVLSAIDLTRKQEGCSTPLRLLLESDNRMRGDAQRKQDDRLVCWGRVLRHPHRTSPVVREAMYTQGYSPY